MRNRTIIVVVLVALLGGVLAFLYGATLIQITRICYRDDAYSHGLLLPFVMVFILWDRKAIIRKTLTSGTLRSNPSGALSPIGLVSLLLGMFLYFVGESASSLFAQWVSLFPTLLGIFFLVLGRETGSVVSPPVMLLFLAKPLPDSLIPRLFGPFQNFAARVSAYVLDLFSVPVHSVGNIIEIPGMRLLVEEACSGMRSLMALLTVSIIVWFLLPVGRLLQVSIVLISVLVALALNVFRVACTGLLAHFYSADSATGFFHTFSGLIVFILGLIIVYSAGRFLLRFADPLRGNDGG